MEKCHNLWHKSKAMRDLNKAVEEKTRRHVTLRLPPDVLRQLDMVLARWQSEVKHGKIDRTFVIETLLKEALHREIAR